MFLDLRHENLAVKVMNSVYWVAESCPQQLLKIKLLKELRFPLFRLHEEIEDFYEYMQPLPEEVEMRNYVIQSVKDIVLELWPNAEVC